MKRSLLLLFVAACILGSCSKDDEKSNMINGHEYVDLGLSVKWATCNVGALKPEDCGNYYSWGSITPNTMMWFYEDNPIEQISGTEFDVAHINWGASWRMPTKAEVDELIRRCTWTWVENGTKSGYQITGTNGNSIFMVKGGILQQQLILEEYGYYWTSDRIEDFNIDAWCLEFIENRKEYVVGLNNANCMLIRPVSD